MLYRNDIADAYPLGKYSKLYVYIYNHNFYLSISRSMESDNVVFTLITYLTNCH